MDHWMKRWVALVAIGVVLLLGAGQLQAQQTIPPSVKIGGIFDTSGPTSDVGVDYSKGALDHIRYINEVEGGIRGKVKIDLVWSDYGYKIPEAVALYRKYRDVDRVTAIIGWGTGDTEALTREVARDRIPYISASYSSHLNDPKKAPYNFYPITSYSDQLRGMLKFFRALAEKEGIKNPKIVFIYPDVPYGRAPIPAGKEYAKELGFEIGPDQIVALTALEARSQMLGVKSFGADFAWIGGTTNSTAVIIRDAKALGLRTRFGVNVWGYDENLLKLAGAASEGVYGNTPHAYYGEPVPGMKKMFDALRRFHGKEPNFQWGTTQTPFIASYVRGWMNVYLLKRALEIIVENYDTYTRTYGGITGPAIKAALESIRGWDPEGLTPRISITADDHRPSTTTRIFVVKNGRITLAASVSVERRPNWLGF